MSIPFLTKEQADQAYAIATAQTMERDDERYYSFMMELGFDESDLVEQKKELTWPVIEAALREQLHYNGYPVLEGIETIIDEMRIQLGFRK